MVREIAQCASVERVESIKGDQRKKAEFTLLAPAEGKQCLSINLGVVQAVL